MHKMKQSCENMCLLAWACNSESNIQNCDILSMVTKNAPLIQSNEMFQCYINTVKQIRNRFQSNIKIDKQSNEKDDFL